MPLYEYECLNPHCGKITEVVFPMAHKPELTTCQHCASAAKFIISKANVSTGAGKARVFYQYPGTPDTCPPDLRDVLKNQDRPKGLPEFAKEALAVVPEGKKQEGKECFK